MAVTPGFSPKSKKVMGYIKIWVHLVWSTKNRQPLLVADIRKQVFDSYPGKCY